MKKKILLALTCLSFLRISSQVVQINTLASGFLYPVCIQNSGVSGDNRLFVVEKKGKIKIVDRATGTINSIPFLDITNRVYPVSTTGDERGLLGLAFHPDYSNNGYFYVNYVDTNGKTVIARFQVSSVPDIAMANSEQILLNIFQPYSNHKGGNLMFGPRDGYLYIALGDGGSGGDPQNRAQNIDSLLGKTLRIDVNNPNPPYYFSAPGNPFYGATPGRDEIFDWGLRNHWRCSFDRLTHDIWMGDVGQNQYEEINFRSHCDTLGHNYGWRCYEATSTYNTSGCQPQSNYTPPVYEYGHSLGCSVTGGYVYRGGEEGGLFGKYLFTDYCQGRIWALVPNGSGGWIGNQLVQSTSQINYDFSSWGEDVYGELYLAGVSSGKIFRLRDTACAPVAYIHHPDTLYSCSGAVTHIEATYGTGLNYNWSVSSSGNWSITSGQGSSAINISNDQNSIASIYVSVYNGTCAAVSNTVVVIPYASLMGSDSAYCTFSSADTLTGYPAGGSFSGPGITGNVFDPAIAGAGTHTITYTFSSNAGDCFSDCILSQTKTVMVNQCTGLNEIKNISLLKVYPNPASSKLTIDFYIGGRSDLNIYLRDALGRKVVEKACKCDAGKQSADLEVQGLSEGIYFLSLEAEQFQKVEKIIIRK
ncbi:MAG: PQQ-dependent sugar dehydrogenase [Bacteroidia bacterium]|nr:PQQ-dependent sugar dehydrogenase [Bacteroidia bacterium]